MRHQLQWTMKKQTRMSLTEWDKLKPWKIKVRLPKEHTNSKVRYRNALSHIYRPIASRKRQRSRWTWIRFVLRVLITLKQSISLFSAHPCTCLKTSKSHSIAVSSSAVEAHYSIYNAPSKTSSTTTSACWSLNCHREPSMNQTIKWCSWVTNKSSDVSIWLTLANTALKPFHSCMTKSKIASQRNLRTTSILRTRQKTYLESFSIQPLDYLSEVLKLEMTNFTLPKCIRSIGFNSRMSKTLQNLSKWFAKWFRGELMPTSQSWTLSTRTSSWIKWSVPCLISSWSSFSRSRR